ncbi:hypothetical protein HF669_09180 [Acidithiobacillus thiooxidans]|uniref:Mobilization protein n=2 Tax=Acidithiobacillus thiooxidans TaxID=930 RepID=A0A1C2IYX0_ACITH|nr:hypothetical protein [Acidithiobacillus thiooxidans]MBU2811533.1 hypothetical protein [Acidithiobacillus thiooxidans]OCX76528.1 hypothetical protein A6O24_08565 [Acidithiobacillus thiooxidans]OCX76714.1 hypothetical protein A6P07_01965 [Acidithiobacillus thiooxidans]OCX81178.1 hypothetical protein A6O26_13535 [Acidithiobacillus thiooxidans]OCX89549.1 hypothetical protein A6M27_01390 [Acidithiobacillus thiooxidans]
MAQNLDQKIAEAEARLARLREESRKKENSQKILLGGMLIHAARKDPKIRQWLLEEAERSITRDVDKKRLEPLLDTLRRTPEPQPENRAEILSDTATITE